jgi:hypothetical protein
MEYNDNKLNYLFQTFSFGERRRLLTLSPRLRFIYLRLFSGESRKSIATDFDISRKRVDQWVRALERKGFLENNHESGYKNKLTFVPLVRNKTTRELLR